MARPKREALPKKKKGEKFYSPYDDAWDTSRRENELMPTRYGQKQGKKVGGHVGAQGSESYLTDPPDYRTLAEKLVGFGSSAGSGLNDPRLQGGRADTQGGNPFDDNVNPLIRLTTDHKYGSDAPAGHGPSGKNWYDFLDPVTWFPGGKNENPKSQNPDIQTAVKSLLSQAAANKWYGAASAPQRWTGFGGGGGRGDASQRINSNAAQEWYRAASRKPAPRQHIQDFIGSLFGGGKAKAAPPPRRPGSSVRSFF